MRQATRRQVLEDMGIVPWRLRVAPGAVAAATASATRQDPVNAAASPAVAHDAPASAGVDASANAPRGVEAAAPGRRWAALSLALGTVLLVIDGDSSRRELRLAMDLLAAATGDWQGRPVTRRFDWPPEVAAAAVATDDAAGRRAFGAFLDKDLADHGARLLLCVEPLATALATKRPAHGVERLVIPALDVLGREAAVKRDLWRALQRAGA